MPNSPQLSLFIYSLSGGGAERMFLNLANGFTARGYDVDLVLVTANGGYLTELDDDVSTVELGGESALEIVPRLVRYLRHQKPAVLLSTTEVMNIVAITAGSLATVRTRVVIRVSHINSVKTRQSKKHEVLPYMQKYLYKRADHLVAISDGVKEDILSRSNVRDAVTTIYNPAYVPEIERKAESPVNHEWFDSKTSPVLLAVGRLVKEKKFSTLLRAAASLNQPVRVIILGEGDKRNQLKTLSKTLGIDDMVSLPGFVDNPFPYMKASDVFVLSSASEAFGNVLVEAMALGTPVVSTDCPGGPAEILENGAYGPLVPVGDHEQLAVAIEDVLREPKSPKLLKQRARDFSLEPALNRYEAVLFEGLNG